MRYLHSIQKLVLLVVVVSTAGGIFTASASSNEPPPQYLELGLDNLGATLTSHPWTCILLYDPWDERETYEQSMILEGLAQRYAVQQQQQQQQQQHEEYDTTASSGSSDSPAAMAFGRLNVRQHSMVRDALTGANHPDHEKCHAQDYYDQIPDHPNDYLVLTNETFLNFQMGTVYWPAQLVIAGPDFNVYAYIELQMLSGSVPLRMALLETWLHQAVEKSSGEAGEPLFRSRSSVEKDIREELADQIDNSFSWAAYERDQRMKKQAEKKAQQQQQQQQQQQERQTLTTKGDATAKQRKMRLLLETDSKDDGRAANEGFFVYRKATVKKIKNSGTYLDVLHVMIDEYIGWVEGYEVSWSPERKAREDLQTNFGTYLEQMNAQLRQLVDDLLDPRSTVLPQDPKLQERLRTDPKLTTSRRAIPNLKGYFEEVVFGPGRTAHSFQQVLQDMTETLGATPAERRTHRSRYNGTEFPVVGHLREYLGVVAEVDQDRTRFSLVLAELTASWNNIMRDFHKNLNTYYITKYLKHNPRPQGNNFQFRTMDILDMHDSTHYNMLSNYQDFHDKYTSTGTPVILSNVQLTRLEVTLETLVQACAASDVTKSVQVSRKVGERQAGNGWGGLETYVLDDILLNEERKRGAKHPETTVQSRTNRKGPKKKNDRILSDDKEGDADVEDADDNDNDGIDRSLTMQQFAILSERIDTLYLHDYTLLDHCDHLLYDHTPYDEEQKFQIPSVIASYDLFQRLPHSSFASSWPSLFVGKKGSNSKLHIDNAATGFFMHLVSGRKRWVVYNRDERVHLYERIDNGSTYPDVLGIGKNEESDDFLSHRFPLLHRAEAAYEIIQEPGQLVYIPPNCPHAVENLEDTIGLAMNIVPREGIAAHLHHQLHGAEFGVFDLAMNYLLFEDHADHPVSTKDPLYTTFGEYKSQY